MKSGLSKELFKAKEKPIVTIGVFVFGYILIGCISCLIFLKVIGFIVFYVFGILYARTFSFHSNYVKVSRPFLLGYGSYTIAYKDIKSVWFFEEFFNKSSLEIFLKNGKKEKLRFILFLRTSQIEKVRNAILEHTGKDLVSLNW